MNIEIVPTKKTYKERIEEVILKQRRSQVFSLRNSIIRLCEELVDRKEVACFDDGDIFQILLNFKTGDDEIRKNLDVYFRIKRKGEKG